MMGLATGRYTIFRSAEGATDEYGDPMDTEVPVYSNVLGSIIERSRSNYDPVSGRVSTIRELSGRFSPHTDLQDGDRVMDAKTEEVFLVTSVHRGANLVGKSDILVDLMKA